MVKKIMKRHLTVAAAAPRSLRQGQVFKACWNLKVHPTPFITLSFLSRVTESTFSILDTKYSSAKLKYILKENVEFSRENSLPASLKTSSRKFPSRHCEIKA